MPSSKFHPGDIWSVGSNRLLHDVLVRAPVFLHLPKDVRNIWSLVVSGPNNCYHSVEATRPNGVRKRKWTEWEDIVVSRCCGHDNTRFIHKIDSVSPAYRWKPPLTYSD